MKRKVFFATPTYDFGFSAEYTASMLMTGYHLAHQKIQMCAQFVGGMCFIDIARNKLVTGFLNTDATDLFFIDADVGWDYKCIPRFLDYEEEIVAGLVPKRAEPTFYHDNALTSVISPNGLLESLEAPTAFMRIRRSVFEKLDLAHPEYANHFTLDCGPAYFQTGYVPKPDKDGFKDFLGEDIFFCRQWIAMGGKIWIDPQVEFSHRGSKEWKGMFIEHAIEKGTIKAIKEDVCPVDQVSRTGT
jgi:hypothetical protein